MANRREFTQQLEHFPFMTKGRLVNKDQVHMVGTANGRVI